MRKKQLFQVLGYWATGCATIAVILGLIALANTTVWGGPILAFLTLGGAAGALIWQLRKTL